MAPGAATPASVDALAVSYARAVVAALGYDPDAVVRGAGAAAGGVKEGGKSAPWSWEAAAAAAACTAPSVVLVFTLVARRRRAAAAAARAESAGRGARPRRGDAHAATLNPLHAGAASRRAASPEKAERDGHTRSPRPLFRPF
jgi:hypothetical protein